MDRLFVLEDKEDRGIAWYREGGRDVDVKGLLDKLGLEVPWTSVPTTLWDPARVARSILDLTGPGKESQVYVNVSTGPKTVGIGATLASLFGPVSLYYAEVNYANPPTDPAWGRPVVGIQRIPTFRAEPPDNDLLQALAIMATLDGPREPKFLKKVFRDGPAAPIQPPATKTWKETNYKHQAIHAQFESLRRRLASQHLIVESNQGDRRMYQITPQGLSVLRMFSPELV